MALGYSPNGKKIAAEKAGVSVTDRGLTNVDTGLAEAQPSVVVMAPARDHIKVCIIHCIHQSMHFINAP